MLGDEGGVMERLREIGEDGGMECAKSVLLFFHIFQLVMFALYHYFLNLTALSLNGYCT